MPLQRRRVGYRQPDHALRELGVVNVRAGLPREVAREDDHVAPLAPALPPALVRVLGAEDEQQEERRAQLREHPRVDHERRPLAAHRLARVHVGDGRERAPADVEEHRHERLAAAALEAEERLAPVPVRRHVHQQHALAALVHGLVEHRGAYGGRHGGGRAVEALDEAVGARRHTRRVEADQPAARAVGHIALGRGGRREGNAGCTRCADARQAPG
mmetsp:Transcript_9638/g.30496  ORF Transcript_9638/g.30496 Transcript_9638/m.30496 type:complete len:216 (-) Transcript_9638:13-660(-)